MITHNLDFTHAYPNAVEERRKGVEFVMPSALEERVATRLAAEQAKGPVPFLDYAFLESLRGDLPKVMAGLPGAEHLVVLGIGGSALGAKALQKAFAPGQDRPGFKGPWLWIADNVDAQGLEAWLAALPADKTLVAVISKSGGTIETMAQYFLVRVWLQKHLGDGWKKQVVVITDQTAGPLRAEATKEGLASLPVPDNMGGRYSIFSAVGLMPAAFLGIDWNGLARGASFITLPLVKKPETLAKHPAYKLALWAYDLMRHGYGQLLFFSYVPLWTGVGPWFAQLWAESLGKGGNGSMPIPAVGVTDQHSMLQMFLDGPKDKACIFLSAPNLPAGPNLEGPLPEKWAYLQGQPFGNLLRAEATGTRMALTEQQVPLVHLEMQTTDAESMGRLMGLLMAATILTGYMLEINPLDQPAVELGKRLANARLGASGYEQESASLEKFLKLEAGARPFKF